MWITNLSAHPVGLPLAEIAELIDNPDVDEAAHLARQRELLTERISGLHQMVSAVDAMMEAKTMNTPMSPQDMAELFGTDWNPDYQDEAEQRWGDTEAWAQSQERGANMSRADGERVKAESDRLDADMAQAVRDGVAPGSQAANALAERHRASIDTFYDCTYGRQVLIARMYVGDQRFRDRYEAIQLGLAQWLHDVIVANAQANGLDPEQATWD